MQPESQEQESFHTYEHNPVPWWVALMWIAFFVFAISYLLVNLL